MACPISNYKGGNIRLGRHTAVGNLVGNNGEGWGSDFPVWVGHPEESGNQTGLATRLENIFMWFMYRAYYVSMMMA